MSSETEKPAAVAPEPSADGTTTEPSAPERPEVQAAAAFVGAFLLARILRRITE